MLIKGSDLTPKQREIVLSSFVYRWTIERERQTGRCPGCAQRGNPKEVNGVPWHDYHVKLITDDEWLREHAFHFVKDGSRLMANKNHAEPILMVEDR